MQKSVVLATDLDFRAEILKERIYATLALLAVLLTIDTNHTTPIKAAGIVAGTAASLWAASLIATQMSRRIIKQQRLEDAATVRRQYIVHAPLLFSAVLPVIFVSLAIIDIISLSLAIDMAIGFSLLTLLAWSLLSARSVKASKLTTLLVASLDLAVGLAVVGLKAILGH